jgi:hypothetical protein
MNTARDIPQPIDDNTDRDTLPIESEAARDRRIFLDVLSSKQAELTRMEADIAELREDIRRQKAAGLESPPIGEIAWLPLIPAASLVVGDKPADYERVRKWCAQGKITCEKRGGQWWVQMQSLWDYVAAKAWKNRRRLVRL